MAGAKFEYDEQGSTFYYFIISFYLLVLIPCTYYFWPRKENKGPPADKSKCNCEPCQSKNLKLRQNEPWNKAKRRIWKVVLVISWIGFVALAYKVAHIQIEHHEYDPYAILGVDSGADTKEIKKAYRKLSKILHPDRGGDPQKFVQVAKAYEALTNEDVRANWEQYGNPDGPGVMRFGIALPSWIVDKENSFWVLAAYVVAFMVILPTSVGIWWYRSMRYSADSVLLDTTQLYYYFFNRTSNMVLKRVIMILGASFEFERTHNKEISERPSDDIEIPLLMKELPQLGEKNKERPLCFPYSIRARALIHAHLLRLRLPEATLDKDREYVISKCNSLVQEMVTVVAQLVAFANAGRIPKPPALETLENVMKLSAMLVQSSWETWSPLMQLPHFSDEILRYCVTKKRHVKSCSDLAKIDEEDRLSLFRSLEDDQIRDIMNVLASMPKVTMSIRVEVQDDEDKETITAGALVTVYVELTRVPLIDYKQPGQSPGGFDREEGLGDGMARNVLDEEGELLDDSDLDLPNGDVDQEQDEADEKEAAGDAKPKPVWQKKQQKKKGGKGAKKKPQQKPAKKQPVAAAVAAVAEADAKEEGSSAPGTPAVEKEKKPVRRRRKASDEESVSSDFSDSDLDGADLADEVEAAKVDRDIAYAEDEEMLFDDEVGRKERILETKSRLTHEVHSPFYPEVKQEWWWAYVCDRKRKILVTSPALVTSLRDREEVELKFPAPASPGPYNFQVCLRSDSYLDCDQYKDIKLVVHPARQITEHPQWNFQTDDEKENSDEATSNESDYTEGEITDEE